MSAEMAAFWTYVGLVLAIVSIGVSVYLAIKYAERKDPRLYHSTTTLISRAHTDPDSISVSFRGEPVERVSSTIIWFWNAGKKPLLASDIPSDAPLIVTLKDDDDVPQILECIVRSCSREAIKLVAADPGANAIQISFSFLDYNDGGIIEIQHDGSSKTRVEVSGVVLGAPKGIRTTQAAVSQRMLLPGLPRRHRSLVSRRPSLIGRLCLSALILAVGVLPAIFLFGSVHDIVVDREILTKSLSPLLSASGLPSALDALTAASKYRFLNFYGAYLAGTLMILSAVPGLFLLWSSPDPFPPSLGTVPLNALAASPPPISATLVNHKDSDA